MRVRAYRESLLRQRQNAGNAFLWILVVLAVIALGWLWWNAGKAHHKSKAAPSAAKPQPVASSPPPKPATNAPLVSSAPGFPRAVQTIFEAQLALDRIGISSGSLDGRIGSQTRAAIRAFQAQSKLPLSGELDAATKTNLSLTAPLFTNYVVVSNDLARLQPLSTTWLGKSQQTALDYETILELLAEKSHSHPDLIRRLNPGINFSNVVVGTAIQIPDTTPPSTNVPPTDDPRVASTQSAPPKAAFVRISLSGKSLEAFDEETNLLVHFPVSIAQRVEKRPVGELHVAVIAPNPNYTFDPEVFPESPEAQQLKIKLILPPGPNNPVGAAWIGLDKTGYGIHGTPKPEDVGRTESHGCFRLANWNAERLLKLAWMGMPVYVDP
jgi:lipoprotein-anchoring transpeptidase ErfK/SrfK